MQTHLKGFAVLTVTGLLMAACQSKLYQVNGSAESMADGDTLYLTTDMTEGVPTDTIIVSDGHFSLSGETDTVRLCMIYSAARNEINIPFFLEPGTISIKLSDTPGNSRVGGTSCNDAWQQLNDSVMAIGLEINRIAEHIYGNTVSQEEQQKGMRQIEQLNKRFSALVCRTAEKHIDNEFGYFLLTYYPEELIDNATRQRLIDRMPAALRNRPAIQQLQATIKAAANTAEGASLPDFTQPAPDGKPLSMLAEVHAHRITIIDFWASWCGPCRQDMPFMISLYERYKDRGLGIVGVSLDSDRNAWQKAIADLSIPWPQMSDLKGWENAAAQQFDINSIPHTIVVDQQGKILKRGLRGDALEQFVASQLQ